MQPVLATFRDSLQKRRQFAALLLCTLLLSFVAVPDAEAACPGSGFTATGFVDLISCTEAKNGADVQTIAIPVPAATALGDLLVAVVATDGQETINSDSPLWTKLAEVTAGNNDATLAVWKKVSDGSEPANYSFSWGSVEQVIGYMMRFTGSDSDTLLASASGQNATGAAVAPSLNTAATNSLILRIFAQDDDDYAPPADGAVAAGHETITEDESSNGGGSVSSSAAFVNQPAIGATGTATFAQGGDEQWAAITLAIEEGTPPPPPVPPFACPDIDGSITGTQLVVLEECTQFQSGVDATAINIPAPAAAAVGDLLVAVINTDGDELPFAAVPAGWSVVTQTQGSGFTQAIYSKLVTASEPGTYNWTLASGEQRYGYLLHFSGASGTIIPSPPTVSTGFGNAPATPAMTTTVDNTVVVRIATSDDDDAPINPGDMITNYNDITSNSSSEAGAAVSGQAAYINQEAAGLNAAETFSLDANEAWYGTAIGIEPIQFEFELITNNTMSTCAIQEVRVAAVNSAGAVLTNFTGTVNLSTNLGQGTWSVGTTGDQAENPANLNNSAGGSTTNGQAAYTFTTGDLGEVTLEFTTDQPGSYNFNLTWDFGGRTFTETQSLAQDPNLTVDDNCSFRIAHDGNAGTCGIEPITITLVDSDGNPAENYQGTALITVDSGIGNFSVNTGTNNTTPNPDNDNNGSVSYTFDLNDAGVVILDYEVLSAAGSPVSFNVVDDRGNGAGADDYLTDGGFDPSLTVADCEFRIIISDTSRDVCSSVFVTFEVRSNGTPVNYVGTMDFEAEGLGDWNPNGELGLDNSINGTGNGEAQYTWDGSEGGSITLAYQTSVADASLSFTITNGTAANGASVVHNLAFDPTVEIANCNLTIVTPSNTGSVCSAGLTVRYEVTDRDGAPATTFNGLIVLQTAGLPDVGDYALPSTAPSALTGGYGDFTNFGSGNASYQFDSEAGDQGVLEVLYSVDAAVAVTLTAVSAGITVDNTDGAVTFTDCEFRITFIDATPGNSDVCSAEVVRIELVDGSGATVTDYTGTINLSTNDGSGGWAVSSAEGTVFDPNPYDGSASYTFIDDGPGGVADDDGVIELVFTHPSSGNPSVNIDVSDGTTTDPGNPGSTYDPNLNVALCHFEISYDGGATNDNAGKTACDVQQVTIQIYRSVGQGGGLATDYAGDVIISTSTNHGNWQIGTPPLATGGLTDTPGDDDGEALYTFNGIADGGEITLDFINLNTETMTVNVIDQVNGVDGVIIESGAADPQLEITSCLPVVEVVSCDQGPSPLSNSILVSPQESNASLRGRMVLVATAMDGNGDVTSVTFDGVPMTLIRDERADDTYDNNTELWGILDADIDPLGGNLAAQVIHNDPYDPAMCVFFFDDVEQVFPTEAVPPESGPLNGDQSIAPTAPYTASTTITTSQNNALVVAVASGGSDGAIGTGDYDTVSPNPPMSITFQGPDSTYFIFAGASGFIPSASAVTIDMTPDLAPERYTQIVAAFNPLISGPPAAANFEPVVLFETYSGDISYRAIGASLRTRDNEFSPGLGETIEDVCVANTFADANLTLPEVDETALALYADPVPGDQIDSNVLAAYLYWFGSGDVGNPPPGVNFDEVTFTFDPGGGSEVITSITADELFDVQNLGGDPAIDYFAAYKDVTALVTATGQTETYRVSDHPAVFGPDWDQTSVCGGGWSMVVVYENPFEQLRVINLFHGFQPFQNSAFTLVPRNFRMASPNPVGEVPNGQVTHVTLEGDYDLDGGTNNFEESLKIQDQPGSTDPNNFIGLETAFNPAGNEFNGTVTRPVYELVDLGGGDWKYQFDSDADNGTDIRDGYEIDFLGDQSPDPRETGSSWGVDIDTHYISGDVNVPELNDGNVLYPFANAAAEEITTRYASGQDLVLLVSEVISVMNAPIADLEITISETSAPYRVHSTGTYQIDVHNNGNGASSFGTATGNLTVTGNLPAGMTFAAAGDVSGTGWDCTTGPASGVTLNPAAFTCNYDIAANIGSLGNASVDPLNFTVQIGGPHIAPIGTPFPSLNNDAKIIVRLQHNDGTCTPEAIGVMPDPAGCESPEFDNVNDLQGGIVDIDDLDDKTGNNNNVDSVTTNVRGIVTNLAITKTLEDVLEDEDPNVTADFTITVTNFGPDPIFPDTDPLLPMVAPTIEVDDVEPSFIQFDSFVADAGWTCDPLTNPGSTSLNCDFNGTLLVGASTSITLTAEVTGTAGSLVSNTATVDNGPYNFDPEPETPPINDPDSDSDGGTIVAPPASATERFLMSVSGAALTTIGSGAGELANFEPNDLIIFDPVLDEATMFLDNSAEGFGLNDINAVHLLPNGHIVLSTASSSTVGDNNFAFDANDLVIYDPITRQGSLLFDGDSETETTGVDIDAVYVLDNGDIVFSTASDVVAGIGWSDSDLVLYDVDLNTFSIYLTADDNNVFDTSSVNVDTMYMRVDPADSTQVLDTFIFSSSVEGVTVGDNNASFGRDDVVELAVDTRPDPTTGTGETLFRGNIPIGVFSAADPARTISALHVIEDAYYGHFSITQSQAGSACQAGQVTIRKHQIGGGSSHQVGTDYTGSVLISLDGVSDGDWSIAFGNGTLDNGTADDGQATYTFVPSDNGQVTLNLNLTETIPVAKSVNVNVSNSFIDELGTEDPTFNFNLVITNVTYGDNFDVSAYSNKDGTTSWDNDWQEIDGFNGVIGTDPANGFGPGLGNIQISGSTLSLTTNPTTDGAGIDPSMTRDIDLSLFTANQTTYLDFDYSYASLNLSDSIVVEVSDDGSNWVQAANLTGLQNTNGSPTNVNVNLSTLGGALDDFTGTLSVRFRVANGYTLASTMFIHDVEIATGTTDCGIGVIDHYHIGVATTGIACVASTVTITGHDANHFPAEPGNGTVMNFSTSTGAGTWADLVLGSATLVDIGGPGTNTDGQGSYTWFGSETSMTVLFNYTDPAGDTPIVNIDIAGIYSEIEDGDIIDDLNDHDPSITFSEAGLRFFDENTLNPAITSLPFQIAGKPSLTLPTTGDVTVQMIRSVAIPGENQSLACESLVPDGSIVTIKLAGLCENPANCATTPAPDLTIWDEGNNPIAVPTFNSPTLNPAASGVEVDLLFENQPTLDQGENNIGARLNLRFSDAGQISLHGEYEIPLGNDLAGVLSGDTLSGASTPFVVRPFGLDIDFSNDRGSDTNATLAVDGDSLPFARAGVPFETSVRGVQWESADDLDQDGLPDTASDLSDNAITPNFGNESGTDDYAAEITVDTSTPGVLGGVTGEITAGFGYIDTINNGISAASQSLAINEVGIFDLDAVLVDDALTPTAIGYLGASDTNGVSAGITGRVNNVGRIYPNHFVATVSASNFVPRIQQGVCAMTSSFTYLGEEFEVSVDIQAQNAQGESTLNYFGDFTKITQLSELDIRAIADIDGAADIDLAAQGRLEATTFPTAFDRDTGGAGDDWVDGQLQLSGNFRLNRQASGAEEAPFESVKIAFAPIDNNINDGDADDLNAANDVLLDSFDVEIDDGITEPGTAILQSLMSTPPNDPHEFRYGRLIVENAFGPETEDLGIPFRIEYFDGTNFVTNTADSCTAFLYDVDGAPALDYIANSYVGDLDPGETVIENGELVDVEINVFEGVTNRLQDGDTDDSNDTDRPLITSAPDPEGDDEFSGQAMVEFDLGAATLDTSLEFLSYDWRGDTAEDPMDPYDEIPDGDHSDFPRGVVEFGSYRGHDRVINWQELFITD